VILYVVSSTETTEKMGTSHEKASADYGVHGNRETQNNRFQEILGRNQ
jgi:hypothetical protein